MRRDARALEELDEGLRPRASKIAFEKRLHVMLFEEVGLPIDGLPEGPADWSETVVDKVGEEGSVFL